MTNICLQFGQCGGQLGYEIFDSFYNDSGKNKFKRKCMNDRTENDWFTTYEGSSILEARSIVADTENKVFAEIQDKMIGKAWKYNKDNLILSDVGGSGNNWAKGFFENGSKIADEVIERVRKENEKCDNVGGFFSLMSSAGGTGSGVGTYVCQKLKDVYPKKTFVACLILPNANGEVTVQNYNTMFTISKLYESCDSILNFSNDYLQKICSQVLHIKDLGYKDLNKLIGGQISCVFNSDTRINCLTDALPLLTVHPDYKLLNLKASPYFPESSQNFEAPLKWEPILRHIKMMISKAVDEGSSVWDIKPTWQLSNTSKQREFQYYRSVANLIACSGNETDTLDSIIKKTFNSDNLFVPWISRKRRCFVLQNNISIQGKEKFCVLVSNNGMYIDKLDEIINRAWNGFIHQAYTHHFYNYGSCAEDFVYTFAQLENIVHSYSLINT